MNIYTTKTLIGLFLHCNSLFHVFYFILISLDFTHLNLSLTQDTNQ